MSSLVALGVVDAAAVDRLPETVVAAPAAGLAMALAWLDPADRRGVAAAAAAVAARADAFAPVAPAALDDAAAAAWLEDRAAAMRAALDRLRGCAEWVATAHAAPVADASEDAPPAPSPDGRAWLRARAARLRAQEAALAAAQDRLKRLAGELAPLARAVALRPFGGARPGADLAILAPAGAGPALALRAAQAGVALTGPWPAYSFVEETDP